MRLKGNVKLKWEKQTVDGYLIYRLTEDGWKEIVRIENTEITSIFVPVVDAGVEVIFKVVYFVYDEAHRFHRIQEKKIYSQVGRNGRVLVYAVGKPQMQIVLKVNNGVKVKWGAPNGSSERTKYRVFRRKKGEKWTVIACVKGTEYIDNTALIGETYSYTVRCISDDEKQYLSNFDTIGLEILYI